MIKGDVYHLDCLKQDFNSIGLILSKRPLGFLDDVVKQLNDKKICQNTLATNFAQEKLTEANKLSP